MRRASDSSSLESPTPQDEVEDGFEFLQRSWADILLLGMLSLAYGCLLGMYAALFVTMERDILQPHRTTTKIIPATAATSAATLQSLRAAGIALEVVTALDMLCLGALLFALIRSPRAGARSRLAIARLKLEQVVRMQLHHPPNAAVGGDGGHQREDDRLCGTIEEEEESEEDRLKEAGEQVLLMTLPPKQTFVRSPIGTVLDADVWTATSIARPSDVMVNES